MEFQAWPKTPRLVPRPGAPVVITEKLDGVNAGILIEGYPEGAYESAALVFELTGTPFTGSALDAVLDVVPVPGGELWVGAQSRTKLVTPRDDNYGFAVWVMSNARTLAADLGAGRHMGEWWGSGIRRGYQQSVKRFSLFNTRKWGAVQSSFTTPRLHVVPILAEVDSTDWTERVVTEALSLRDHGSRASAGYKNPEGVCAYHRASDTVFKYTLDGDGHKGVKV